MNWSPPYLVMAQAAFLGAAPIDVSTSPPGGLDPEQVPQLIFITFDDSTTHQMYDNVQRISGHTNPDGSPVGFTFFVSLDSAEFHNTHKLHAEGHEIAVHTVSHTTGTDTSLEDWAREIASCRAGLIRYAGIPAEEIRGFRAPFLAYNAHTFRLLHDMGFDYDSSVPETVPGMITTDPAAYIWPYHLHDGLKQNAWTGSPPDTSLPELMEVPMWNLRNADGGGYHNMDPAEATREDMLNMLKQNFTTRYEGNRIPVALWLHVGWTTNDDNINALNDFLTWALAHDDVWVVPVHKLVDWMHNPLPVDDPDLEELLTVQTYEPIPEAEALYNAFDQKPMYSVHDYLPGYPSVNNLMLEMRPVDANLQFEFQTQGTPWNTFTTNLVVTNPTGSTYANWQLIVQTGETDIGTPWNVNQEVNADGSITLHSQGVWSTPISPHASQQVLATFYATGTPDDLEIRSGTALEPTAIPPVLRVNADRLNWEDTAPMYELQGRESLAEGSWITLETLYGETQTPYPETYLFFRLKPVY